MAAVGGKDIVLDLGSVVSKMGFVGEGAPRHVASSACLPTFSPPSPDVIAVFLAQHLVPILLSPPAGRRFVVVEGFADPSALREAVVAALLIHLKASSVLLVQAPVASAVASGTKGGASLVVHLGWSSTTVLPAVGDAILVTCAEHACQGIERVHAAFAAFEVAGDIAWDPPSRISGGAGGGSREEVDDAIAVACSLSPFPGGHQLPSSNNASFAVSSNRRISIQAQCRTGVCECLFGKGAGGDPDLSAARLLLDSLMRCPVDTRAPLASNLVLSGGGGMLPGFGERLIAEARLLCSTEGRYASLQGLVDKHLAVRRTPFEPILLPWAGASAMGAASKWEDAITLEAFQRSSKLPEPLVSHPVASSA